MPNPSRKRRKQPFEETLGQVSAESSAVIEAMLQLMAALKKQPGFDGIAFDQEVTNRISQVPPDMHLSKLILKAAAALPHRAMKARRPRTKPVEPAA